MSAIEQEAPAYRLIDELPDVAAERAAVRAGALALLDGRRQPSRAGIGTAELIPVDALSTADRVLEAEALYGPNSVERAERWDGLAQDCLRLVAECYRKKKPEYFAPLRHTFDERTQSYYSHGLSVTQMTYNALVPMSDNPEEEARRVNERVEDATPLILRKHLGKLATGQAIRIRTISECTDKAQADYAEDVRLRRPHRSYNGYVPEIDKLMIRDIEVDEATGDRLQEQIALPGFYYKDILPDILRHRRVEIGHMNKTQRHGAQLLATDDLMEFMRLMDDVASEQWCVNIFAGEVVPDDFVKDYAGFRDEAIRRQEGLKDVALTVATFVLDLAQDEVDRRAALPMVEEFVKKLLLKIGKDDLDAAEQMFDVKTANGLREVAQLEADGRYEEAHERMQIIEREAPGVAFCGAGSCGLEDVNVHSETGKELLKSLRAEAGDTIVRDKVRTCSKCGNKKVAYAYNKTKVNKYCEGCDAFESKVDGRRAA
ncbi:MAG TPA: hypothetical protein VGM08_01910 [Candidatus Saccharimonadales bacterium]|jgi:hypothetical protein